MVFRLQFGENAEITLDLPNESVVIDRSKSHNRPIEDIATAVKTALDSPVEFPRLADAIVPGDQVAIAVARGVPKVNRIVSAIVEFLVESGVLEKNICLVVADDTKETSAECEQSDLLAFVDEEIRNAIEVVRHDAGERTLLSFLAPSEVGEAIYFNRRLADADVVLPVGPVLPASAAGLRSPCLNLFPEFADDKARKRFANVLASSNRQETQKLEEEAIDAVWRLGVMMFFQVVPGMKDTVVDILAGQAVPLAKLGQTRCADEWTFTVDQQAELTIAAIDGGPEQQTWANLARALELASYTTVENGSIALVCELDREPGVALQRLIGDGVSFDAMQSATRDEDATFAAQLDRLSQSHRIYLLSGLAEDVVESLGMAYVSSTAEIARLASRHSSCALIGGAQFAEINRGQTIGSQA